MMESLATNAIGRFQRIVGEKNVRLGEQDLQHMGQDWLRTYTPAPTAIIMPSCATEVQEIVSFCKNEDIKIVPSGGRTGLSGGATAMHGEIVLSLSRLNKVLEVNRLGMYATVQAGVTTQTLQEAARRAGVMFAVDLAARGSSQIGGNIATNAGGTRYIRYGGMREQVLGLDVVLPSGQLLKLGNSIRKNNTGYALHHLFIGAEGTLGIITEATVKLVSKPKSAHLVCFAVDDFTYLLQILDMCHLSTMTLNAFEFFSKTAYRIVLHTHKTLKPIFPKKSEYYALVELDGNKKHLEELVTKIFNTKLSKDGVVAQSSTDRTLLWSYRDLISESLTTFKLVHKNDVSVPIPKLGEFLHELHANFLVFPNPDIEIVVFGHIGDGNLHINYASESIDNKEKIAKLEDQMHELVKKFDGSVSAEHGIGLHKKKYLPLSRSPAEISLMQALKKEIDPQNIMNPGKIFDF